MITQFLALITEKTWNACCAVIIWAVTSGASQLPVDVVSIVAMQPVHGALTRINYTTVWGRKWSSNSLCYPRLDWINPNINGLQHLHHRRTHALLRASSGRSRAVPALRHSYLTRNKEASPEKGKPRSHPNGTVQRRVYLIALLIESISSCYFNSVLGCKCCSWPTTRSSVWMKSKVDFYSLVSGFFLWDLVHGRVWQSCCEYWCCVYGTFCKREANLDVCFVYCDSTIVIPLLFLF